MGEWHVMNSRRKTTPGQGEWFCPECGRTLRVQWLPFYQKTVIFPGDESAVHTGGTSETEIESGAIPVITASGKDKDWLSEIGIDWDEPTGNVVPEAEDQGNAEA